MPDPNNDPTSIRQNGTPTAPNQRAAIATAIAALGGLGAAVFFMSRSQDNSGGVAHVPPPLPDPHPPVPVPNPPVPVPNPPVPEPNPPVPVPNPPVPVPNPPIPDPQPPVTHQQTFAEAFHEARMRFGDEGGHTFTWNNGKYSTYYLEEWQDLGPEQQHDYLASVYGDNVPALNDLDMGDDDVIVVTNVDDQLPDDDQGQNSSDTNGQSNGNLHQASMGGADHDTDSDVEVVHPYDITSDVEVVSPGQSSEADVVVTSFGGHSATLIDIDHDNHPDIIISNETHVILADTNHDHLLDTQGIYHTGGTVTNEHAINDPISIDEIEMHHTDTASLANNSSDFGTDFIHDADNTGLEFQAS